MAQSYAIVLANGDTVTVSGVDRAEKDGSGRRFFDKDGNVVAEFGDGQAVSHYPVTSKVKAGAKSSSKAE